MPNTTTIALIGGVIALVVGYIVMLKVEVSNLKGTEKELRKELLITKSQISTFKTTIQNTNKIVEAQKLNLDAKEAELEEWRTKPPVVKYKTIYRDVIKDLNLTGECDEVKNLIDSTTSINLNSL